MDVSVPYQELERQGLVFDLASVDPNVARDNNANIDIANYL